MVCVFMIERFYADSIVIKVIKVDYVKNNT